MMEEDKDLLLRYLCMALPYGVKVLHEGWNYEWDDALSTIERIVGIDENFIYTKVIDKSNGEEYRDDKWSLDTFDDKPYLRPISSMTEEELIEFNNIPSTKNYQIVNGDLPWDVANYKQIVWLLKNHFDFMGLIPDGLAIAVTENNNPYK